jgi:hypothetical protein
LNNFLFIQGPFTTRVACRKTIGYKLASNGAYYKLLYQRPNSHQEARDMCKVDGAWLASAPYGQQDRQAFNQFVAITGVLQVGAILDGIIVDGTDAEVEGIWKLPNGKQEMTNDL